jgi:hypothetical protein
MSKRQIELLIESISFHQLHLQKMYEQHVDEDAREYLIAEHEELCKISKLLIRELDKYDKEN